MKNSLLIYETNQASSFLIVDPPSPSQSCPPKNDLRSMFQFSMVCVMHLRRHNLMIKPKPWNHFERENPYAMKHGYEHGYRHGTRQIQKNEDTDTAGNNKCFFNLLYI